MSHVHVSAAIIKKKVLLKKCTCKEVKKKYLPHLPGAVIPRSPKLPRFFQKAWGIKIKV